MDRKIHQLQEELAEVVVKITKINLPMFNSAISSAQKQKRNLEARARNINKAIEFNRRKLAKL